MAMHSEGQVILIICIFFISAHLFKDDPVRQIITTYIQKPKIPLDEHIPLGVLFGVLNGGPGLDGAMGLASKDIKKGETHNKEPPPSLFLLYQVWGSLFVFLCVCCVDHGQGTMWIGGISPFWGRGACFMWLSSSRGRVLQ